VEISDDAGDRSQPVAQGGTGGRLDPQERLLALAGSEAVEDPTQQYEFSLTYANGNSTAGNAGSSAPVTTPQATAPAPAPRYAVIDLGTSLAYPMKVTSSGYVLGQSYYVSINYVWHNGTNVMLQPNSSADSVQATDVDNNGRVVGLEITMNNNNHSQLATWAPGSSTASLTSAPVMTWANNDSNPNDDWSYQYYFNALASPNHIWSSQLVFLTAAKNEVQTLGLEDGFEDTTELGNFSVEVGPPYDGGQQYTTGAYDGTPVAVAVSSGSVEKGLSVTIK
jgi:hypothetical protein